MTMTKAQKRFHAVSAHCATCGPIPSREARQVLVCLCLLATTIDPAPSQAKMADGLGMSHELFRRSLAELAGHGLVSWWQAGSAPAVYSLHEGSLDAWVRGERQLSTPTADAIVYAHNGDNDGLSTLPAGTPRARGNVLVVPPSSFDLFEQVISLCHEYRFRYVPPSLQNYLRSLLSRGLTLDQVDYALTESREAERPSLRLFRTVLERIEREARFAGEALGEYDPGRQTAVILPFKGAS